MDVSVISPMSLEACAQYCAVVAVGAGVGFFSLYLMFCDPCSIYFLYYTPTSVLLLLYSTLDIVGMHGNGPKRLLNCPTWMIHCAVPKEKNTTVSIVDGCNLSESTPNRYVNSSCLTSLTFPVKNCVRSSSYCTQQSGFLSMKPGLCIA